MQIEVCSHFMQGINIKWLLIIHFISCLYEKNKII